MPEILSKPCTAFAGHRLIAVGSLIDVALAVKAAIEQDMQSTVLTFDDATGEVIDLDLRGTTAETVARLTQRSTRSATAKPKPRSASAEGSSPGPGRPRLGVIAREVTLLPRHWEWLADQPGGASQALRRLVEEARRSSGGRDRARIARERAYRFMSAMAGDLPGFEEASRALFAGDCDRFTLHMQAWPADIHAYARRLASCAGSVPTDSKAIPE
jgi:hypothetical protein